MACKFTLTVMNLNFGLRLLKSQISFAKKHSLVVISLLRTALRIAYVRSITKLFLDVAVSEIVEVLSKFSCAVSPAK